MEFLYTEHILMRMDEREISANAVEAAIRDANIISAYTNDQPYPSNLYLSFIEGKALHVVAATKGVDSYIIISVLANSGIVV